MVTGMTWTAIAIGTSWTTWTTGTIGTIGTIESSLESSSQGIGATGNGATGQWGTGTGQRAWRKLKEDLV